VLRPEARDGVDLVIVRENVGGLYLGRYSLDSGAPDGVVARHAFEYREREVRRLVDVGVRLARARSGRIALVVKPGGLPTVSLLFTEIFTELAAGLDARVLEVDNATFQLIAAAPEFDVVVAPNLFGDILSDGAGLLLGSRGLTFSGNFGPGGRAAFQTGHGAAFDLVGRDLANPLGQILAAAMMLGEGLGHAAAARRIETAVETVLRAGLRTQDIAEPGMRIVGTREMAETVAAAVAEARRAPPVVR
jgi:3-isopropylmalate dehydrogenase